MSNKTVSVTAEEIANFKRLLSQIDGDNSCVAIPHGINTNCGHCSGLCLGSCSNYCVEGCKDVCDGTGNSCNKSHYR